MNEFRKIDDNAYVNDKFYIQKTNNFYSVYIFKIKEFFKKINDEWNISDSKTFKIHKRFIDIDLLTAFLRRSGMKNPFIKFYCPNCYSTNFYYKTKSIHLGMYCVNCDKWIKWIPKKNKSLSL
jgi:hypothetical protein